jgi:hypothetical protein
VILRDDSEPLIGGTGVRYRFIGQTSDFGEAVRMAESLRRRCAAGEIPGLLGLSVLLPAP